MRKIDYWDLDDAEYVSYTSVDEAVEGILERFKETGKEIPETLTLTGFAKKKPDEKSIAEDTLETLLWYLDDMFRDDATEPTDGMKQAAVTFVKKVLKDYTIFNHEPVCAKEINVRNWLKRHPEWGK